MEKSNTEIYLETLEEELNKFTKLLQEKKEGMGTSVWWGLFGERKGNIEKLLKEGPGK